MTHELHPDLARVLISEEAIRERVRSLAAQLMEDYAGVERLYVVGVLKGAFIFLADLVRELSRPVYGLPHTVDFMAVSSYGKKTVSTGEVRLVLDLREPIVDTHVLLVEDIIDTGHTLRYLLQTLGGRSPASLRSCVLVQKEGGHSDIKVDYLGFTIPDVWVVGYGLDYADRYRTLPYIAELRRQVYAS